MEFVCSIPVPTPLQALGELGIPKIVGLGQRHVKHGKVGYAQFTDNSPCFIGTLLCALGSLDHIGIELDILEHFIMALSRADLVCPCGKEDNSAEEKVS
jgi:hypothetical protein